MLKKRFASLAALIVAGGLMAPSVNASTITNANLILNGDFSANASSYTQNYGYDGEGTNPTNPTDWTTVGGSPGVNGTDTSYQIFGPKNPTTLNGTIGMIADYAFSQGTGAGLKQTFSVVAGTTYSLTYDAAARNQSTSIGTVSNPAGIIATVTDPNATVIYKQTSNFTNADSFYSNDNAGGNYFTTNTGNSLEFTALTSGSATLAFVDYGSSTDHSADFTNVSVTAVSSVPEPASFGLALAGFGLLLLVPRRRQAQA